MELYQQRRLKFDELITMLVGKNFRGLQVIEH